MKKISKLSWWPVSCRVGTEDIVSVTLEGHSKRNKEEIRKVCISISSAINPVLFLPFKAAMHPG